MFSCGNFMAPTPPECVNSCLLQLIVHRLHSLCTDSLTEWTVLRRAVTNVSWAPPPAASTALFKQQCCYSEWLIEGRSNTVKDFIQNKGWAHHHASGATEGATRAWLGSKRTRSKEQAAPSRLCRGNWCVVPSFFAVSVNQTVVCVSQNAGPKVVSVWANLAH